MSKDNKKLLKYLAIIFIAVLMKYKLPHDSYPIIKYIIRPIKYKNAVIYLSGIIPLVLLFIGIRGMFNLKRVEGRNKLLLFLLIIMVVMPIMKWSLDLTRTGYHWLSGDGLRAVDVVDSNVSLACSDDELTIVSRLELIDYSRGQNKFKIRIYLPRTLRDYTGEEFYEFENEYITNGKRNIRTTIEKIVINTDGNDAIRKSLNSNWYWEDIKYELYDENETVEIISRGL